MRVCWTVLSTAVILAVCSGANVLSFRSNKMADQSLDDQWVKYEVEFNKFYHTSSETKYRRLLWEDSLREMQKHNAEADLGLHTWWMAINQFSDMTTDEWADLFPTFWEEPPKDETSGTRMDVNETLPCFGCKLPKSIDWNQKGKVTPVKDQRQCGSCYAFASVGAIESAYAIKYKQLLDFSEQEIVDCSKPNGNNGCHGGHPRNALQYVKQQKAHGINLAKCYPYIAKDDKGCKKNTDTKCIGAKVNNLKSVHGEDDLKVAVAKTPVAIGVCLPDNFKKAGTGVFSGTCRTNKPPQHAMLVVGYGADPKGNEYWDVKNSHGKRFGNLGYIKIARNKNIMDLGQVSVYPIVA